MAFTRKTTDWRNRRTPGPFAQRARPGGMSMAQSWISGGARHYTTVVRILFASLSIATDFAAIMVSAVFSGWIYHHQMYGQPAPMDSLMLQGYVIALLFIAPIALRGEYSISRYLRYRGHIKQIFLLWNTAFVTALTLAFLTKTSADVSRGSAILFYAGGAAFVCLIRLVLVRIVQDQVATGQVSNRRVFLVGFEDDVRLFTERYQPWTLGIDIVSSAILRDEDSLQDDLVLAAASARVLRPEDIFILVPWSRRETVEACINAFLRVPASIYLGPERILDRFADLQIERFGPINSLQLARRPLSPIEIVQKRVFDMVMSSIALILLSPLFALIALLIKLDSRGPVFFLQRRYGFNQEPFRIYKFRSMSTLEDGRIVTQVSQNDTRVTRIGRLLRRTNIDELPQLINVLRGNMSLVGPRPHALAHDQMFERQIANYARRHNVRPGITGWAQVNGLRGETDTRDKMFRRVEHDLYYIDHWSMWFDIRILFLTVFSPKSYRNAV